MPLKRVYFAYLTYWANTLIRYKSQLIFYSHVCWDCEWVRRRYEAAADSLIRITITIHYYYWASSRKYTTDSALFENPWHSRVGDYQLRRLHQLLCWTSTRHIQNGKAPKAPAAIQVYINVCGLKQVAAFCSRPRRALRYSFNEIAKPFQDDDESLGNLSLRVPIPLVPPEGGRSLQLIFYLEWYSGICFCYSSC